MLGGKKRDSGKEKFEVIMVENFLKTDTKLEMQEAHFVINMQYIHT